MHGQEGHGQHQRDGDAHHQAGPDVECPAAPQRMLPRSFVQTQAQEADGQHDRHGLDQHLDELVDRIRDRLRLVLHLHQLHAQRQGLVEVIGDRLQGLAQLDDVATFGH
jgi:hypothetical protein